MLQLGQLGCCVDMSKGSPNWTRSAEEWEGGVSLSSTSPICVDPGAGDRQEPASALCL